MTTVLITGSQGFIGSYLCQEFLQAGYRVVGIDNYSKYGELVRPHDRHPSFVLHKSDLTKTHVDDIQHSIWDICRVYRPNYIIASAAMIGGISYFHKYAYDLIATNERINANTLDAAIPLWKDGDLKKVIMMSSSMVYENVDNYPSREHDINNYPPPDSTYGFQKLSSEYFCKGLAEQYGIDYNIVRPFNCVGIGEDKSLKDDEVTANNVTFTTSHVLPDLIRKINSGQNPVEILGTGQQIRTYTNGKDIAHGVRLVLERGKSREAYNISSYELITVIELAERIWKILRPDEKFNYTLVDGFSYDVQSRIPCIQKAKKELDFEAKISLDESIREVIEYICPKKIS